MSTCPIITSETSDPSNPTLIKHSLIAILPNTDAFNEDKDPQYDPTFTE